VNSKPADSCRRALFWRIVRRLDGCVRYAPSLLHRLVLVGKRCFADPQTRAIEDGQLVTYSVIPPSGEQLPMTRLKARAANPSSRSAIRRSGRNTQRIWNPKCLDAACCSRSSIGRRDKDPCHFRISGARGFDCALSAHERTKENSADQCPQTPALLSRKRCG
jgi:hypothetical protein